MQLLIERARELGLPLTQEVLRQHAQATPFFAGVEDWFDRINAYAAERQLALEHYVVSSANAEMLAGTRIAHHFKSIFGCKYMYDADGNATWPSAVINYTTKTQFLFRINKGVDTYWDDEHVNRWVPMEDRPIWLDSPPSPT